MDYAGLSLARALHASAGTPSLASYRPARLTRVLPSVVDQIVATVVQRGGLTVPRVHLQAVDAPAGAHRGETLRRPDGSFTIYVLADLDLEELWQVLPHELQHVHDIHSGGNWQRIELEERAIKFAALIAHTVR